MRPDDWPEKLEAYLRARSDQAFAWGANDCVTFAMDWVASVTGRDPIFDLRGWTDARAALRAIDAAGGIAVGMARRFRAVPIGEARRGDIGIVQWGRARHACVIIQRVTCCGPGPRGLEVLPRAALLSAYEVA